MSILANVTTTKTGQFYVPAPFKPTAELKISALSPEYGFHYRIELRCSTVFSCMEDEYGEAREYALLSLNRLIYGEIDELVLEAVECSYAYDMKGVRNALGKISDLTRSTK